MSYSNTATLINMPGGAWPPVTARLWQLWTVLGTGSGTSSGTGPQAMEQGTNSPTSAGTFSFTFPLGPSFSSVSRGIGVSLQDTARVGNNSGWWFRSGRFETDLPSGPIEVVLLPAIDLTRADFAAALPRIPIAMSPARNITFLSVTSGTDILNVTIAGVTTELGVPVRFTCSHEFALVPSARIALPESELLTVEFTHPPLLSFSALPSDLAGTAAAASLNALALIRQDYVQFIANRIMPTFVSGIEARFVTLAIASLSGLIAPGATSLPAGVIPSVRFTTATVPGLTVLGSLGAFDGVFSKFPPAPPAPAPSSGSGRCFIAAAATSAGSAEVLTLQAFRDTWLLGSGWGTRFVRFYEAVSPALADRVRGNDLVRSAVRYLVVKPGAAFARLANAVLSHLARRPSGRG